MAMRPPEPNDAELAAPEALVQALRSLPRETVFVPEAVDAAILRRARRRLRPKRVTWWAAAAAAMIAVWLGWVRIGPGPGRHDVNRDGRVDIRDALLLARRVADGNAAAEWDFNRDGIIDQRDAEVVARRAVQLAGGGAS